MPLRCPAISRYFVCTYCSEFVSLSHLYLHCLFSVACYYFYWAIFSRTGRSRSDSLTWTLLPSSLHKTDWIWMRSLVLMSIIFISQDIFFRTLPAINYVVYLFFLLPCYSSVLFLLFLIFQTPLLLWSAVVFCLFFFFLQSFSYILGIFSLVHFFSTLHAFDKVKLRAWDKYLK